MLMKRIPSMMMTFLSDSNSKEKRYGCYTRYTEKVPVPILVSGFFLYFVCYCHSDFTLLSFRLHAIVIQNGT